MTSLIDQARAFYSLALTDPAKACDDFLAENFVLENYLPEHFPFGGCYEGPTGFLTYLQEISSALEMGPLEMDAWVCDGNEVVVRGTESSLVKSTNRRYSMRFVHWLSFNDEGRVTVMREYNDTAEMAGAFDEN